MEKISILDIEKVINSQENTINLLRTCIEYVDEAPEIDYSDAEKTLVGATIFINRLPQINSIFEVMYDLLMKQKADVEKLLEESVG